MLDQRIFFRPVSIQSELFSPIYGLFEENKVPTVSDFPVSNMIPYWSLSIRLGNAPQGLIAEHLCGITVTENNLLAPRYISLEMFDT